MAQVYFHCSNTEGASIDQCGAAVGDLTEARDTPALVVRSLDHGAQPGRLARLGAARQRRLGDEILTVPFASLLGKPH